MQDDVSVLLRLPPSEFLKFRGIGRRSFVDLNVCLWLHGYELNDGLSYLKLMVTKKEFASLARTAKKKAKG
jgi:hypothetical protein